MEIDVGIIEGITTVLLAILGWFCRSLLAEMKTMSSAIIDLGSSQKVLAKTVDIINDGMLENREHVGELFAKSDEQGRELSRLIGEHEAYHGGKK